jgi:hypothetical protein
VEPVAGDDAVLDRSNIAGLSRAVEISPGAVMEAPR